MVEKMEASSKIGSQSLKHYYVGVGTASSKLESLVELITAFEGAGPLSFVICCGSRDVLDAVVAALHSISSLSLVVLHSDMSEREIDSHVQDFRQSSKVAKTTRDMQTGGDEGEIGDGAHANQSLPKLRILVITDAPLRVIDKDLTPLGPTLLINYDLPNRKEDYVRRMMTILGSRARTSEGQRLTINFFEAGQITKLRQFESFAEREVKEMPVQVADILAPSCVEG